MKTEQKQLSTVSNPLVLTYRGGYYVSKPGDQTGGYVSKEVAQGMLDALNEVSAFLEHIEGRVGEAAFSHITEMVESAIHKATQP